MKWTAKLVHLILVTGAVWWQTAAGAANTVYVSPAGDDANPGTAERPLATLEAARDAARQLTDNGRSVPEGGVQVVLQAGRYPRTATFELDERDSGAAGRPIVYTAQPGTEVILDGGVVIPSSAVKPVTDPAILNRIIDEAARPHIVQINLRDYGVTEIAPYGPRGFRRPYRNSAPELFINGAPQTVARWPNAGEPHIPMGEVVERGSAPRDGEFDNEPGVIKFGTDRAHLWAGAEEMFLSGIFAREWADDTIRVAEIDVEREVFVTDGPHLYGFINRSFTAWFAINLLEEIDVPGEYFIDRASNILYLYPPHELHEALIQVSRMGEVMIAIEGASHLHIERLTLENGCSSGIYIERGESNRIAGCTIRNMGKLGIQVGMGTEDLPHGLHDVHGNLAPGMEDPALVARRMGSWHEHIYKYPVVYLHGGYRHRIESCDIHDTGAGGINLVGGNRKTLKPGGHEVVNCNIYRVNRLDRTYKACINVDGVGQRIVHNRLHSTDSQAIYMHGNDHLIAYNNIHDVVLASADMGAIYMGRDATEAGHVIRHNFFHHIFDFVGGVGTQAMFFDDGTLYAAQIFGNVFYRSGSSGVIKNHQSLGNSIANNIAVNSPRLLQQSGTGAINFLRDPDRIQHTRATTTDPDDFRGVDIRIEPYKSAYPLLLKTFKTGQDFSPPPWNNVETSDLSMFVDPDALDFTLKPDAPPLSLVAENVTDLVAGIEGQDMPFQDIPFAKIGLYQDDYRQSLPPRRERD